MARKMASETHMPIELEGTKVGMYPPPLLFNIMGFIGEKTPGNAMQSVWELTKLLLGIPFKQIGKGALKFPSYFSPQSKYGSWYVALIDLH